MTPSLRIVHCFRSPVGGIFRHVRDLVEAQAACGHEVGIICDSTTGGELEERFFAGLMDKLALGVERIPIQRHIGPSDMAAAWHTYRHIKRLKPDVLHGHGAKGGALARLFGSLLRVSRYRVARLYTAHGGVLHYDPATAKGRTFFALERLMDRFTDHVIFVSDYERRTFLAKIGVPRADSSLVYNGLQPAEFEPVAAAPDAADLLFVGMMRDLKGPDIFIDAVAAAGERLDRAVSAVMVGDGDGLPDYRRQVERLGLRDQIKFLPPMPARDAFALGRILVASSRAEAMPYLVLEALAAGKSMIATAVGGVPEIFGPGSAALTEPDAAQVAERIVTALRDEAGFAGEMPAEADLRARFGADVMAAKIEDAYRSSLGQRKPSTLP